MPTEKQPRKIELKNGNSYYLEPSIEKTITEITKFMEEDFKKDDKKREFSIYKLSKLINRNRASVRNAVFFYLYIQKPRIKLQIRARKWRFKGKNHNTYGNYVKIA